MGMKSGGVRSGVRLRMFTKQARPSVPAVVDRKEARRLKKAQRKRRGK